MVFSSETMEAVMSLDNLDAKRLWWLYQEHYRAYRINKVGGYTEQAAVNRRCMREILSRCIYDRGRLKNYQAKVRYHIAHVTATLDRFITEQGDLSPQSS